MSLKIINLFEFERPVSQANYFPLSSTLWGFNPNGIYTDLLFDIMEPELLNEVTIVTDINYIHIVSSTDRIILAKQTSQALAQVTESSFYFNGSTLFIHFPNTNSPYAYSSGQIVIGAYDGYYTSTNDSELDLFGGFYEPRLQSFPLYRSQLDNFATGRQAIAGGSVVLNNTDGALNNFSFGRDPVTRVEVLPKIGWYGRIRQAILDIDAVPADSDFIVIEQGVTSKIQENVNNGEGRGVEITLRDMRASLDKDIPIARLSATTWNKLNANNLSNLPFVPIIYGRVSKYKCVCLNEVESSPTYYKYLLGNTSTYNFKSVLKIYIQNQETALTATIQYTTQSTGENIAYFEVARAQFATTGGYIGYADVSADIEGYQLSNVLIENALEVTEKLIEATYGETYTAQNYNTTQWAIIKAIAPSIGIVIDRPTKLKDIMQYIQTSIPLSSFKVDTDQRYTWIDYTWDDAEIIFEIKPDAMPAGFYPSPNVDSEQIAAKIQVNYDYRYTTTSWARNTDTSNVTNAIEKYNTDRTYPEEYNTPISNSADADLAIERLKQQFIYPNTTFDIAIPMQYKSMGIFAYQLKAGDKIKFLANADNQIVYGWLGCIIHEIKQDINSMQMQMTIKVQYTSTYTYKQPIIIQSPYDSKYLGDGAFLFGGIL